MAAQQRAFAAAAAAWTSPRPVRLPRADRSRLAAAVSSQVFLVKSRAAKRKATADAPPPPPAAAAAQTRWPRAYVETFALTPAELQQNGYPSRLQPCEGRYGGRECKAYESTGTPQGEGGGEARLLAVDCEMCYAQPAGRERELQLARVSVVDDSLQTVFDELVLPEHPICDYNTAYSGITAEMMQRATLSRAQVVDALLRAMGEQPSHTFLVGHSLESDLHALRLEHRRVIDTAVLFPLRCHVDRAPSKAALRVLTARHLGREIQQSDAGHDATEDAKAAMELALLKLRCGHAFGLPGAAWGGGFESLGEVLRHAGKATAALGPLAALHRLAASVSSSCASPPAAPSADASLPSLESVQLVPCLSDEEAVERTLRLSAARNQCCWLQLQGDGDAGSAASLQASIERLRRGLPANTLLAVLGYDVQQDDAEASADASGGAPRFVGSAMFSITPGGQS
ncbi:hypothetical protein AB1Y20_012005 [Prymnesium parvum]|uniref:Exonuclease domain-containing protein n=1 Tax=Prymnesium parvum TaxID=97485 RepID=A0AB34IN61_PRYPA